NDRPQASVRDAAASLLGSAAVGGAHPEGERPRPPACHPQGRRAEPDQPACGLPFPHPLSLRACALPRRVARVAGNHPRTLGVLPSTRRRPNRAVGGGQGHRLMAANHAGTPPEAAVMKLALLDDYHGVALQMAVWARLAGRVTIESFSQPLPELQDQLRRLGPFDAILAMRERTPFPRAILEQLPRLKLLITTGMWNAAIDMKAATDLG